MRAKLSIWQYSTAMVLHRSYMSTFNFLSLIVMLGDHMTIVDMRKLEREGQRTFPACILVITPPRFSI